MLNKDSHDHIKIIEVLKELENADDAKILEFFKFLDPSFNDEVSNCVTQFNASLGIPRTKITLTKKFNWTPSRRNLTNNGFDADERRKWVESLFLAANSMKDIWNPEKTILCEYKANYNWDLATKLTNFNLWNEVSNNKNSDITFEAPEVVDNKTEKEFKIIFYPIVTNPNNKNDIWGRGNPINLPKSYKNLSLDEQKIWWNNYLEENLSAIEKEIGVDKVETKFHKPNVSLQWDVLSPDLVSGLKNNYEKEIDWRRSQRAKAYLTDIDKKIDFSYEKSLSWASVQLLNELLNKNIDNDNMLSIDWEYMGVEKPNNISEYLTIIDQFNSGTEYLKNKSEHMKSNLIVKTLDALSELPPEEGLIYINNVRDWYLGLGWITEKEMSEFIDLEKGFVENNYKGINLSDLKKTLSGEQYNIIVENLLWNTVPLTNKDKKALFPSPVKPVEDVVKDDVLENLEKNNRNIYLSKTDWSELGSAFDIDVSAFDVEKISIKKGKVKGEVQQLSHPFMRWMDRLSPTPEVDEKTQIWLQDNQVFNKINRLLLKNKNEAENSLNVQMVEKLKNVMEISSKIIQESAQNSGWFGRIRNSFKEGTSTDNWADAFMDFQNHMVVMYAEINKQLERDKVWMKYADDLVKKAENVDISWSEWIHSSAHQLEMERNNNKNATGEEKMIWNEKIEQLKSAGHAHEHIRSSSAVNHILLEKVRQSMQVKEKLQQRTMMFYWSSLSMFAGLQSLQRNMDGIFEQAEMVQAMSNSYDKMTNRTSVEEMKERAKIREAFKSIAQTEESRENFFKTMTEFQKDAISILKDMNDIRIETQEEAVTSIAKKVKEKRAVAQISENNNNRTNSNGPR